MKFSELKEEDINGLAEKLFKNDYEWEIYHYGHYFGIQIIDFGFVELMNDGDLEINGKIFFNVKILMNWINEKQLEFES
jgi:hypothetical protein